MILSTSKKIEQGKKNHSIDFDEPPKPLTSLRPKENSSTSKIFNVSSTKKISEQTNASARKVVADLIPGMPRDTSEEIPVKSTYDWGPQKILNELKAERLKRNRM